MRKYFLDNIRWGVVVIVLIYHVFYIFNHIGVLGGIGPLGSSIYPDIIMYVVYPWFMVLMFLIAGISARYSLTKRTVKEFLGEKVARSVNAGAFCSSLDNGLYQPQSCRCDRTDAVLYDLSHIGYVGHRSFVVHSAFVCIFAFDRADKKA